MPISIMVDKTDPSTLQSYSNITIIPSYEDKMEKDKYLLNDEVNKAVYADEERFNRLKRSIGILLEKVDTFYS